MNSIPGSSARPYWPLAVVVGAGGLGMAIARRLGQSHRLLIADRDAAHIERQVEDLRAGGYDASGHRCDVTSKADITLLAQAAATTGNIRSLAYVVGLSPSLGDFRTIMSVNLVGAALTIDAFRDLMVPQGAALAVSSSAAHMQRADETLLPLLDEPKADGFLPTLERALGEKATSAQAYMLSKLGLIRVCQRNASVWGRRSQRIVSLSPGLIATPQGAREYQGSPGKMKLFEATPLEREATMLEIANVAEFLLSDRASYITGIDLLVDGGLIANLGCRRFI